MMSSVATASPLIDEFIEKYTSSFSLADLFKDDDKSHLTPLAVVEQLDRFIIGQAEAKVVNKK